MDYHLNEQELQIIKSAIRHDKRPEMRQRSTVIRLLHLGHKPVEVTNMQAFTSPTIYLWINR